jgi:hypothetical protein
MNRIQFIELHEQPWFPRFLRNDITDTLQYGLNASKAYASIAPPLQCALNSAGNPSIVDLCSGSGGPWLDLVRRLKWDTRDFHVSFTDKYANYGAFANAKICSSISIRFCKEPVDARDVPIALDGFRTMFTSFHHFPIDEARTILENAVDARQGIGIFEITRRTPSAILLIVLWSFTPFLFTLFVRPFRWSRLLFTYLVPVIPFVLLFDGVVSCLRTYRPVELREMTKNLEATEYHWTAGELRGTFLELPVTYLVGYPPQVPQARPVSLTQTSGSRQPNRAPAENSSADLIRAT